MKHLSQKWDFFFRIRNATIKKKRKELIQMSLKEFVKIYLCATKAEKIEIEEMISNQETLSAYPEEDSQISYKVQ